MKTRRGMRERNMRYPNERKEAVQKKMLPPNNKAIQELEQEEGICEATLYNWRNQARAEGRLLPDSGSTAVVAG